MQLAAIIGTGPIRSIRHWLWSAACWPLLATAALASPQAGNISLVRDVHGVAHVYANTDTAALYGLGYAQAEDRLFQLYYSRIAYQGKLAEYFGPGTPLPLDPTPNITHDKRALIVGWERHAAVVASNLDAPTLALLNAFCDGVNDYAASPGAVISPLFASTGIPLTPWTPVDCIGVWYRLGSFFSNLGLEEGAVRAAVDAMAALPWSEAQISAYLAGSVVCDDTAVVIQQSDVPASTQSQMSSYAVAAGVRSDVECLGGVVFSFSQAMVANGDKVSTGEALLLGEPRLPVYSPSMLYEASVQGATFTVRGACLPGTANFLMGSTPMHSWSVTALGLDQADLFQLQVGAQHPGKYFVDNNWVAFQPNTTATVVVKNNPSLNESVDIQGTVFGPVVTDLATKCTADSTIQLRADCLIGKEFAMRALPFAIDDADSFQGYMAMYRAPNSVQFLRATEGVTWPSMNMVIAASDGSIAYIANGACPVRKANAFLAGVMALDGNSSANDWQGYLPHHLKPWVRNPAADFLMTANHRPIGAWYPMASLYPGLGDTLRSQRLREVLETTTSFTPAAFEALHLDRVVSAFRDIVVVGKHLRDVQGYPLSANALAALRALIPWHAAGAKMDASQGGVAVAHFLRTTLRADWAAASVVANYGSGEGGMSLFMRAMHKHVTSSPVVPLTSDEASVIDFMLGEAYTKVPGSVLVSNSAMQAWYTSTILTGSSSAVPSTAIAYGKSLDNNTAWTPLEIDFGPLIAAHGATNLSQKSDAFTQFVAMSQPDQARSILPLGVSEHPTSPHFVDQQAMWEAGQLKPAPYSLAGVTALGILSTTLLSHP